MPFRELLEAILTQPVSHIKVEIVGRYSYTAYIRLNAPHDHTHSIWNPKNKLYSTHIPQRPSFYNTSSYIALDPIPKRDSKPLSSGLLARRPNQQP